jgi:hypothetical protein
VDIDDALLTNREVTASFAGLGLPNFDQATRMLQLQLNKTIDGYTLIDFETTVKGIGLSPGDLITITYLKEGLERQPFRVVRVSPGQNFQTVQITARWHDDSWYTAGGQYDGRRAADERERRAAAAASRERHRYERDRAVRDHGDDRREL